jgi:hypothetical protein
MKPKKRLPSANTKGLVLDSNGHLTGEVILLHLGAITEEEAGLSFSPELRLQFKAHIESCRICQALMTISAQAYSKVKQKRIVN